MEKEQETGPSGAGIKNKFKKKKTKKPKKPLLSNYLGPGAVAVHCKRASIGLRAGAFLLHLGLELHLAFPPRRKTVRGLFQGRCKEGSQSPLCMLLALKYSFTACPLEGPFMLRKLSVNRSQAQRAWRAGAREFKPFQFQPFQTTAALNLQPGFTLLYNVCSLGLADELC